MFRSRRDILRSAGALAAAALGIDTAYAQGPVLPAAGTPFTSSTVPDLARALASQAYDAPSADDLPEALKNLNREQYEKIRAAPGATIWSDAGLGFTIEPLHRGFVYTDRVVLHLVEDGVVRPLPYARDRFDSDGTALPDPGQTDIAYSGFRVRARFSGSEPEDFAIFQGVSFFRLIATDQDFGINARALMLRPADSRGEDFSRWRAFFVEKPAAGAPLVLHALLDAQSCTAAFRFALTPGDPSVAEIEAKLFTRAAIDHLGLAGAQSRYLFGPNDTRGGDDARAAAYASGGLRVRTGGDEAIWRPVHNPRGLQISSFLDNGPKGFGLMQRERDYAAFQDDLQHWERKPSLWNEPMGASGVEGLWGEGAVTLLEIPSEAEINENIIAYWRPKVTLPANAEVSFAYRQSWCWHLPDPPPLASVTNTRSGRGSSGERRLFLVDFTGDILFSAPEGKALDLRILLTTRAGSFTRQALFFYDSRKTVRVLFELDPGAERAVELRLALKAGERQVTETWLYRWAP